jgi:hypothetical protein
MQLMWKCQYKQNAVFRFGFDVIKEGLEICPDHFVYSKEENTRQVPRASSVHCASRTHRQKFQSTIIDAVDIVNFTEFSRMVRMTNSSYMLPLLFVGGQQMELLFQSLYLIH